MDADEACQAHSDTDRPTDPDLRTVRNLGSRNEVDRASEIASVRKARVCDPRPTTSLRNATSHAHGDARIRMATEAAVRTAANMQSLGQAAGAKPAKPTAVARTLHAAAAAVLGRRTNNAQGSGPALDQVRCEEPRPHSASHVWVRAPDGDLAEA